MNIEKHIKSLEALESQRGIFIIESEKGKEKIFNFSICHALSSDSGKRIYSIDKRKDVPEVSVEKYIEKLKILAPALNIFL